jgi:ABC-2 type transport system permease protein
LIAGVLVLVVSAAANLDLSTGGIAAATLALGALGLLFGSIALLAGAITGRRALALSVTGAVAVFAYLCNSILAKTSAGAFFEAISPFHWAYGNDPLVNGVSLPGIGLLLGFSVLFVLIALTLFDRRDVGV